MTLRQAYKIWSMAPRNMVLAKNSRDAVEKVLMRKYSDIDLEQITATFAKRLFKYCREPQEMQVKAASVLVYILSWGGDHGYCQRPTFDYTIASKSEGSREEHSPMPKTLAEISGRTYYNENNEPLVKVKPEALEKRQKEKEIMNERNTRGKQPHPVVQIDVKTLKAVRSWDAIVDAQRELKIKNIDRALKRGGIAGGFYWCDKGKEKEFRPNEVSLLQVEREKKKKEKKMKEKTDDLTQANPYGITTDMNTVVMKDIKIFSNDELIAEMRRRGWKGNITMTLNIEL